jgi:hypothetical protein
MAMKQATMFTAVLLAAPAMLLAADAQSEAGRQCAQIRDSLQRLVCYDRVFQAGDATPANAAAPRAAAPAASAPPAATATVRPTAPAVAVAPAAATPAPAMGDESVRRNVKEREAAKATEPTSLEAKVTALRETRPEIFRVTLDNGQVWQQMDMSSLFHLETGDTIRIEKGTMGGYRMARTSKGRSGWVRVTRLQ